LEDFNALASSLAQGVEDVRGCLILSRDGLVLGAHPAEAESVTTPAWVRFAAIGDPERGFAQFGTETWCYVRRGPYAGFALVGHAARPGLVIDHMDQVLLAAEEGRSRHEGLRGTEVVSAAIAPQSKPRSHLHPEHPTFEPLVIEAPAPLVAQIARADPADELPPLPNQGSEPIEADLDDDPKVPDLSSDAFARFLEHQGDTPAAAPDSQPLPETEPAPEPAAWSIPGPADDKHEPHYTDDEHEPHNTDDEHDRDHPTEEPREAPMNDLWRKPADDQEEQSGEPAETEDEDLDVDRFSLAREFGQLLQGDEDTADG
jgi:hypothetical protein